MPCYKSNSLPSGFTTTGRTSYKTEADCLNACKEGACCEGTSCTVKPQCQCHGTGKTFKGVGTTCSPNPCCSCESLVSVTVKLPSVLGGSQVTRAGCNGTIMADSTLLNWTCTSSGFTISLSNSYQTRSDGICQHPAYFASRSYTVGVAATSQAVPCAGVVISGCAAASYLAATTLTKGDFTALPSGSVEFDNSLPLSCWGYGSPSSEVLFPEWVKIGPLSNPLP